MLVQDVFSIRGRHPVVTGKIRSGIVRPGDRLVLRTSAGEFSVEVVRIQQFQRESLDEAGPSQESAGLELEGIEASDVEFESLLLAGPGAA